MQSDPRIRYVVLQPITIKDGTIHWTRVGSAYKNPDGTLDAYLDATVPGHRFRLRELSPDETRLGRRRGPS